MEGRRARGGESPPRPLAAQSHRVLSVRPPQSHAGKVVLRSWYEKNKHIFPASRWEPYDPEKKWDKYTVSSPLPTGGLELGEGSQPALSPLSPLPRPPVLTPDPVNGERGGERGGSSSSSCPLPPPGVSRTPGAPPPPPHFLSPDLTD